MNIAVAQSGGPTCAINASLAGVIEQALECKEIGHIYGSCNGIEGILGDHLVELETTFADAENRALLIQTPATYLGSCRYKMPKPEDKPEIYEKICNCFQSHDIGAFFYIGGNDSMDTVAKLSAYMAKTGGCTRIIGIPKTIDNDLMSTDHTPGFGSAAKYLATTLREITRDSAVYDLDSLTIVEIMGRHAGWLTASSAVLHAFGESAPHLVYVPEAPFSLEKFLQDVQAQFTEHRSVIVAISEGITLTAEEAGTGVRSGVTDAFGHAYLSGIGKRLEEIVRARLGVKVRSIELNVMQRCSAHLASATDLSEAAQIGTEAVKAALNGETGQMMAFERISDEPYQIKCISVPAAPVANAERFLPKEWLNKTQNNITAEALPYFLPLIRGEIALRCENGLPMQIRMNIS